MINIKCTFFLSSTHDKLDYPTLKLKVKRLVRERRGVQSRQVQVDAHSSRDYHVTHEGQIIKKWLHINLMCCNTRPPLIEKLRKRQEDSAQNFQKIYT